MSNIVTVELRDVYGKTMAYPVNQNAKIFAGIAGTKTLSPDVMRAIGMLGFDVKHAPRPFPVGPHDRSWCG